MKKILALSLSAVAVLLMTGCAGKDVKMSGGKSDVRGIEVVQVYGMTKSSIINNTNTRLLQAAAEDAIKNDSKYFTFSKPVEVANANINTTDEFLTKCANKNLGAGFIPGAGMFISDDCNMFSGATGIGSGSSVAEFTLHKEKPAGAALDASEVISALKAKGLYKDGYSVGYSD